MKTGSGEIWQLLISSPDFESELDSLVANRKSHSLAYRSQFSSQDFPNVLRILH
jgi:hypothetical protein